MANLVIARKGYGQVEPNHLSARYNGQVYAQLPAMQAGAHTTPIAQLENGQFLKYNYAANAATTDGDGEWMLVFCEEKLYDERRQNHKDFVLKNTDFADNTIYPRLLKTSIGDIFTTNTFGAAGTGYDATVGTSITLSVGDKLDVGSNGFLKKLGQNETGTAPIFQVVKEYTLPDAQAAVKLQRIQ